MSNDAHFGRWLRRMIEDTGLTFSAFCRHALIPRPTVQRWMDDACPPMRGCNIVRLARALNIGREVIEAKLAEARAAAAEADREGAREATEAPAAA